MSVHRPKRFIFKEPTKQLRRGQACLNCRFHKVKCDGVKPACGPCTRLPKDDPCEYANGSTKTKDLEHRISRLKARVRELEKSPGLSSIVQLTDPYQSPASANSKLPPIGNTPPIVIVGTSSGESEDDDPYLALPEPSNAIITVLLDSFLPYCNRFGFFLDIDRFRSATLLALPFGHDSRPSPALLSCVYLWGIHLAQGESLLSYETIYLRRALRQISWEIANVTQSAQVMHTIQAEVLLAAYFFRNCQFLEAEFHINGAVSLALSCGLHKMHSSRTLGSPIISVVSDSERSLPPARDDIEEHERVAGFWCTFCVQRLLTVASGTASRCFGSLDAPCSEIDTPWPQDMTSKKGAWYGDTYGCSTIERFFSDPTQLLTMCSAKSWFVKSCILLHHSFCLSKKLNCGLNSADLEAFTNQCITLDDFLTNFLALLPPLPEPSDNLTPQQHCGVLLAHSLALCAYLKVQTIFSACGIEGAQQRCINTAHNIVRALREMHTLEKEHLSPIIGTLCGMAVSALGSELERAQASLNVPNSESWIQDTLGMADIVGYTPAVDSAKISALRSALEGSMSTMSAFALDCPLTIYQLTKLQQRFKFS